MRGKTVFLMYTSILLLSLVGIGLQFIKPVRAATAWTVDDDEPADFSTIQEAINAASDGDTIFVKNGTYHENVVVNKAVSLVGESRHATVVNASGDSTGFKVAVDNVTISNFKVTGASWVGVYLMFNKYTDQGVSNCTIANNTIIKNEYGIYVGINSNYSRIEHNDIIHNDWDAIWLNGGYSYMRGNTISKNGGRGIRMECSDENILRNNTLNNDLCILGGPLSEFMHDIDTSNTINGKPIYYLLNQHSLEINSSTHPNPGFLGLINSTNIIIKDLVTDNTDVKFAYVSNSTMQNMTIINGGGVILDHSRNNVISQNVVSNGHGILLSGAYSNTIVENVIEKNSWAGILAHSGSNVIYHNNFIDNTKQVYSSKINVWDSGYPSGGNYWSDYNGTDLYSGPYQNETGSDGIGDIPYVIGGSNQDNYPLMDPYQGLLGDLNRDWVINIEDIAIFGKAFGSYLGHPRWNPNADLDNNGVINILDGVKVAKNFGKTR